MKIELYKTAIPGCFEIIPNIVKDERGVFVKTFTSDLFIAWGLVTHFAEEYFTFSRKNVLRGIHFQLPPHEHTKIVYCVNGKVFDVVVDLRKGSPTFGKYNTLVLDSKKSNILYIPAGLGHGFYTISDSVTMMYKVTTLYSPDHDTGILWNSIDIPWPENNPLTSRRDRSLPPMSEFNSPFIFVG